MNGSKMRQSETTVEVPPSESITVVDTRLVGSRSHRISIEWVLNERPSPAWIAAFNAAVAEQQRGNTVESAYGRPLVMLDRTILWAVIESEMRAAVIAVGLAMSYANLHIGEVPGPT
jgi:hypothetical protein